LADLTLVLITTITAILLAVTTYATVEYFRQLRRAQKEYEKARETVEDIVLSFNRELKREAEKIEKVSYKVEVSASKADAGINKAENIEKRVTPLESKISQISTQVDTITTTMSALSEANAKTVEKLSTMEIGSIDTKMQDIESSQEVLKTKILGLEEQMQKLSVIPEGKTETPLPVMPIKRDKALAALTDTEVTVLEFLSSEGPKTAPEIKEKVQLSREHTARLMKKLYEEGYLERETGKLPFKYSVKKEMEKLLKKPETPATI
jgi:chromosome segregation ATPase